LERIPQQMFVVTESVFDWREGFPLLRLYPRQEQGALLVTEDDQKDRLSSVSSEESLVKTSTNTYG